jgi:hypothetical protein
MLKLDDSIHDLLADDEYDTDVAICEDYIDTAKRAIQKAVEASTRGFLWRWPT